MYISFPQFSPQLRVSVAVCVLHIGCWPCILVACGTRDIWRPERATQEAVDTVDRVLKSRTGSETSFIPVTFLVFLGRGIQNALNRNPLILFPCLEKRPSKFLT